MLNGTEIKVGAVRSLWRYPVKSMRGETLALARIGPYGVEGDRYSALVDRTDGKVATAKHPHKWPNLLGWSASIQEQGMGGEENGAISITLPTGMTVRGAQPDRDRILSDALGREVTLAYAHHGQISGLPADLFPSWTGRSEEYWPDMEGREKRDVVTEFSLPPGTFFDGAMIHLLTTATLKHLQNLYPAGCFDPLRFRPNIVVDTGEEREGFLENEWVGRRLFLGEDVRLKVIKPCARCVMTTLPQGDLPKDPGILSTAVRNNHSHVGVYAMVEQGGLVRRRDTVRIIGGQ